MVSDDDDYNIEKANCLWFDRPDGKSYEGGWFDGKQHGRASYTNSKGLTKIGQWDQGKRIGWI